jgi:hypothetical protein
VVNEAGTPDTRLYDAMGGYVGRTGMNDDDIATKRITIGSDLQ